MYIHVYISVCTGVHDLHYMQSTIHVCGLMHCCVCTCVCSKFCMPAV